MAGAAAQGSHEDAGNGGRLMGLGAGSRSRWSGTGGPSKRDILSATSAIVGRAGADVWSDRRGSGEKALAQANPSPPAGPPPPIRDITRENDLAPAFGDGAPTDSHVAIRRFRPMHIAAAIGTRPWDFGRHQHL